MTFGYDALNRIISKDYPTGADITYTYDETFSTNFKGRLTTLTDKAGISKFYYDEFGQTIKTEKTIDATLYTTETTYDALGRTKTLKYPDNSIVNYTYDAGGNLDEVIDDATGMPYASYLNYNALGQVGQIDFGNGISTLYQYRTDNNRLFSITTNGASGLMNLSYYYDNVGNISGITDHLDSTKSRSYVYDDLDRLIVANSPSYGGNLMYEYDKIGNMTRNCRYGYYHYEDTDHKHAVTRIHSNGEDVDTYAYDANGNMTSGAGRVLTYDYDNMPESITYGGTAVINVYDASGQRVKKVTPTSTTTYVGQGYECDQNGTCTKYIFAGSNRIAKIDSTDTYFYHTDHLGSSSVMTDSTGNSAQDIFYYPYGEMKANTGFDIAKHKFTGQEWDAEYGLYYYNARYYDPKLARFISADTIVPNPFNPQALNRYSYVLNNPIIYIDPSGHGFWKKLLGVVELVVGAVLASTGPENPLGWIGAAMMVHGAGMMGANVEANTETEVTRFGDSGPNLGGGSGSSIRYTGPGSTYRTGTGNTYGGSSLCSGVFTYCVSPVPKSQVALEPVIINKQGVFYDGDGNILGELPLEANPLVDPIDIVAMAGSGFIKWTTRPYWRYVGQGSNPNSRWLTRGYGWKPPYGKDFKKTKDALQIKIDVDDVKRIDVPWYKPVRGHRPSSGLEKYGKGGGPEYYQDWRWPKRN